MAPFPHGALRRRALADTPIYGAIVSAVRAVLVILVALAATSVVAESATAEYDPFTTLRQATRAERRATLPLAEAVLTAYRSSRFAPLCGLFSPAEVKRVSAP